MRKPSESWCSMDFTVASPAKSGPNPWVSIGYLSGKEQWGLWCIQRAVSQVLKLAFSRHPANAMKLLRFKSSLGDDQVFFVGH